MELDIIKLDGLFSRVLLACSHGAVLQTYVNINYADFSTPWFKSIIQDMVLRKSLIRERVFDQDFYALETGLFIEAYIRELQMPIKTVFGQKPNLLSESSTRFCKLFTDIISRLYITDFPPRRFDCFKVSKEDFKETMTCSCGSSDFNLDSTYTVCMQCGARSQLVLPSTIIERVPSDKRNHFINCFNNYQGNLKTVIPVSVFETIESKLLSYNLIRIEETERILKFARVTKEHIKLILKDTGLHKSYGDSINRIHQILTDKKPPEVEHLRERIFQDFDTFNQLYIKRYPHMIKKPFNYQHLLFQFLRRHGHPCDRADFRFLKTAERKAQHEQIYRDLFDELGWNYTPIF
jgi:hypothetical protein